MRTNADAYPVDQRGYTDTKGAADYTGTSESYLNKTRHFGDGPEYVKFGRAVRYSYAALDMHADRQRRSSTAVSQAMIATWEGTYAANPALQREFGSVETYVAYRKAEAEGRCRIRTGRRRAGRGV